MFGGRFNFFCDLNAIIAPKLCPNNPQGLSNKHWISGHKLSNKLSIEFIKGSKNRVSLPGSCTGHISTSEEKRPDHDLKLDAVPPECVKQKSLIFDGVSKCVIRKKGEFAHVSLRCLLVRYNNLITMFANPKKIITNVILIRFFGRNVAKVMPGKNE